MTYTYPIYTGNFVFDPNKDTIEFWAKRCLEVFPLLLQIPAHAIPPASKHDIKVAAIDAGYPKYDEHGNEQSPVAIAQHAVKVLNKAQVVQFADYLIHNATNT